jgi:uncharacterized protein YecT (DUF1311 family)
MGSKRDLVAEIEEVRARRMPGSPLTIPFRMHLIASAFQRAPTLDTEFLRYVPIGVVACIEGFSRSAIAEFIDAGPPFSDNARSLTQVRELRVDLDMLGAVQGRRVSIGELIAHLLPLNSLEQIDVILSALAGKDFLKALTTIVSRWDTEVGGKPAEPIIQNPEAALKHVSEMFRLRHIYAHEIVGIDGPERSEMSDALEASVSFLKAAAEFVARLLCPDAPLTQSDMNQRAAEDVRATDASIENVLNEILSLVDPGRGELLRESQSGWIGFRRLQARFEASAFEGGSMSPQIFSLAVGRLSRERLAYLQRLREREPMP